MSHGKSLSIGELVYDLDALPSFYVAEIETTAGNQPDVSKQCLSRRLRYDAVTEFLNLRNIRFPYALNFKAKKNQLQGAGDNERDETNIGPVDHLIVVCKDESELTQNAYDILQKDRKTHLEFSKERRWVNGQRKDFDVSCHLKKGRIVDPPTIKENDDGLYRRCLTTYVRQRVNEGSTRASGPYPANKDWLLAVKSKLDPVIDSIGNRYLLKMSTKPEFDIWNKQLHLKATHVIQFSHPVVISDFFRDYLGTTMFGSDCSEKLASIRALLIGLQVTLTYPKSTQVIVNYPNSTVDDDTNSISDHSVTRLGLSDRASSASLRTNRSYLSVPDAYTSSVSGSVTQPTSVHSPSRGRLSKRPSNQSLREQSNDGKGTSTRLGNQTSPQGNTASTYRIQEIRLSKDVPRFRLANQKSYSVSSYFEKTKGLKVKFPNLPLARVRANAWIPLEFLQINAQQTIRDVGHLTNFIQRDSGDLDFVHHYQVKIKEIEKEKRSHLTEPYSGDRMFKEGFKKIDPSSRIEQSESEQSESQEKREKRFKGVEREGSEPREVFFIYFPSSIEKLDGSEEFVEDVSRRFRAASQSKNKQNDFNFSAQYETVNIERPLVIHEHFSVDRLRGKDLIVAIIDEGDRTKDAAEQIRAELCRYVHLCVGRLAMCVSKKNLVDSFEANRSAGEDYFPTGLLHKMNYMLGGTNYEAGEASNPLKIIAGQIQEAMGDEHSRSKATTIAHAVIMGAHLAHPSTAAGVGCPSVGAVVGADKTATHYLGSARLQPTLKEIIERKPYIQHKSDIKHFPQQGIVNLEAMVRERLLACSEQYQTSKSIIFFRHGLDPESDSYAQIVKEEVAQIKNGSSLDGGKSCDETKITFITVTRNRKITDRGCPSTNAFSTGSSVKSRYWYHVAHNELEMSQSQLKNLVAKLNQRNQVGGPVSIALPIHFAQKLAKRVFDYFHFYATNSASLEPGLQMNTYIGDITRGHEMDERITEYIKSYIYPSVEDAVATKAIEQNGGNVNQSGEETQSSGESSQASETTVPTEQIDLTNRNPWHEDLDDKMFYL